VVNRTRQRSVPVSAQLVRLTSLVGLELPWLYGLALHAVPAGWNNRNTVRRLSTLSFALGITCTADKSSGWLLAWRITRRRLTGPTATVFPVQPGTEPASSRGRTEVRRMYVKLCVYCLLIMQSERLALISRRTYRGISRCVNKLPETPISIIT